MIHVHQGVSSRARRINALDFTDEFITICNSHKAQGRAYAFAFLFLDQRDPGLRMALEQTAYWQALDQLAGRNLTIFSFDVIPERLDPPRLQFDSKPGTISFLVALDGSVRTPQAMWDRFANPSVRPPCIVFFQVDGERILDSESVQLKEGAPTDEAYADLSEILAFVTAQLSRLEEGDQPPPDREAFNRLLIGVEEAAGRRQLRVIRKRALQVATVGGLLDGVRSLLGLA